MLALPSEERESFAGPHGAGADHCCWDSVFLELRKDAGFILELWSFYERWQIPQDPKLQRPQDVDDPSGRPRANFKVLDETRVTYKGKAEVRAGRAVKFSGFSRPELNCDFLEDASRPVAGQPSWWSADGCRFFYFVEENRHWKVNAVRSAGGDGFPAIGPRSRKAGRGFAHSGEALEGDPSLALFCQAGWFEATDDEWEPMTTLKVSPRLDIPVLRFLASEALIEDKTVRGEDVIAEKRTLADPVAFDGWRPSAGSSSSGSEIRLMLPEVPDHGEEGDMPESLPQAAAVVVDDAPPITDPDIVVLRLTAARL